MPRKVRISKWQELMVTLGEAIATPGFACTGCRRYLPETAFLSWGTPPRQESRGGDWHNRPSWATRSTICNECRGLVRNTSWQDAAACGDADPEIFFRDPANGTRPDYSEAKAICARCPVVAQCLQGAFTEERGRYREHGVRRQVFGVRGGCAPTERAKHNEEYVENGSTLEAAQQIVDKVL